MSTDNTPAAAGQLPANANANAGAGAGQGQPDTRPARPPYPLRALTSAVERMSYLLQGNVSQYRTLLSRLQDPSFSFPLLDDVVAHGQLLNEAERLLHNILTAVTTRVDQQRRFMEVRFGDDPVLTREYLERVATDFKATAAAEFLKRLRNYIAHRQLPVAQSQESYGQQSFRVSFILPTEPLLAWDGWNGATRAWIASHGKAVPIVDVVDTYARIAVEFDRWLADRIVLKYQPYLDSIRAVPSSARPNSPAKGPSCDPQR
jgi:hypothetical protein